MKLLNQLKRACDPWGIYGHLFQIDNLSIFFFWLTNFLFLSLAIQANDIVDKIILATVFIVSFTFHTTQVWFKELYFDHRVKKCELADRLMVILVGVPLFYRYQHKIDLQIILGFIFGMMCFSHGDFQNLSDGTYHYVISHGLWHVVAYLILARLVL